MKKNASTSPAFCVIGAMKAGTSTLYYTLRECPSISMTRNKEPNYFLPAQHSQTFEEYTLAFTGPGLRGDVSPNYARRHRYPGIARRMFDHHPGMKLIYILRDPLERIISHLRHDIINDRLHIGEVDRKAFGENYILTSSYHYQLQGFWEYFPKNQILLIRFGALTGEPHQTLQKIFDFLGLDRSLAPTRLAEANRSKDRYKKLYQQTLKPTLSKMGLWKTYKYFCYLLDIKVPKPRLKQETKKALAEELIDDIRALETETGLDTSPWTVNRYLQ